MELLATKDFNDEALEKLNKRYPTLTMSSVIVEPKQGEEKELKFLLIKPNRDVRKAVSKDAKKDRIDTVEETLIRNCVVGGDTDYLQDPDFVEDPYMQEAIDVARTHVMEEVSVLMETRGSSKKVMPQQKETKAKSK